MGYSIYVDCKNTEVENKLFNMLRLAPTTTALNGCINNGYTLVKSSDISFLSDDVKYAVGFNYNCSMVHREYIHSLLSLIPLQGYYDCDRHTFESVSDRVESYGKFWADKLNKDIYSKEIITKTIVALELYPPKITLLKSVGIKIDQQVWNAISNFNFIYTVEKYMKSIGIKLGYSNN